MKILKWFFILTFLILVIAILILGYFGFFPAVSRLLGSDKPRDLGVRYTTQDYAAYQNKAGSQTVSMSLPGADGKSLTFSGRKDVNAAFGEAEVTSRINNSLWEYMPLTGFQIRFPGNDTLEFSGLLVTDRLSGFISQVGGVDISPADMEKGLSYLKIFSQNTPVYAKAHVTVVENKAFITLQKLEIGRFPIPPGISDINSSLSRFADKLMSETPGFYAKTVSFSDGRMNFTGTVPATISALSRN
jgi:hypothetical protein